MVFKAIISLLLGITSFAQTIPTARFDNTRDGANTSEFALTSSKVSTKKFGVICKAPVDSNVYSQPIYIQGLTVNGGVKNVFIVSTMINSIYAFEASSCNQLWVNKIGTPWDFPNYPHTPGLALEYTNSIGSSNVAADSTYAYVVTANNSGTWTIRKLALATGSQSASATIAGTVLGTGDPLTGSPGINNNTDSVSGGVLSFNGAVEMQRTALTIDSGRVYIGFGSQSDIHPYHGWVFAYNTSDLSLAWVWCSTPSNTGGGVWNGGGGLTVLSGGDLLFATGNGGYDGATAFAQSVVRLKGNTGALVDSFTPSNWSSMNTLDSDLGSGPMMLIPNTTRAVTGAKDYRIFSVDYSCLGGLGGTNNGCGGAQIFFTNSMGTVTDHSGVYNGAFFNNTAYFPNTNGKIYSFAFSSGSFNTTPTTSSATYEFPGAQLSISANGTSNCILWATTVSVSALYDREPGTLRALNCSDMSEYWHSTETFTLSKYAAPVIADGRIFIATHDNSISVYGLIPQGALGGEAVITGLAKIE